MSRTANHFKIGVFVLSGLGLMVLGTIVLGAGALFERTVLIESYFDESVQGLSVGSSVKHRGVHIGTVKEISFVRVKYPESLDDLEASRYVYVLMAVNARAFQPRSLATLEETLAEISRRGLRLFLKTQGLTGSVFIEADYLDPGTNPTLPYSWKPEHYYVPSSTSAIGELLESLPRISQDLAEVDFPAIAQSLETLLATLDQRLQEVDMVTLQERFLELVAETRDAVERARRVLENTEPRVEPLFDRFDAAGQGVEEVAAELDRILSETDLTPALAEVAPTLIQLRRAVRRLNEVVNSQEDDIDVIVERLARVSSYLEDVLRNARDYPSQVIFGEPPTRKEESKP